MAEQKQGYQAPGELVLGYWAIRGRAQLARLILQHFQIPYRDEIYHNPKAWYGKKKQEFSGWTFVDIPYLQDGDLVVTQILPIVSYIIKKHGHYEFLGKDEKDQSTVDMYAWYMDSLSQKFMAFSCSKKTPQEIFKEKERLWASEISDKLKSLNDCPRYKDFLLGYLTVIDFSIYQLVHYIDLIYPGRMKSFKNLLEIEKRVASLPLISKYQKSNRSLKVWFPSLMMCDKIKELKEHDKR